MQANAAEVLTRPAELSKPRVITQNGETKAVPQDVVSFEETQGTVALQKIQAPGLQDVDEGTIAPVADVVVRLRAGRTAP